MLKELNVFPGPGAHDSKSQLKGPKFGFGTSSRAKLRADSTPGPGKYDFTAEVGHVPAYSMANKGYWERWIDAISDNGKKWLGVSIILTPQKTD